MRVGQRYTSVLLAKTQYATTAAATTEAVRTHERTDKWGDRLNVTIFFSKTTTDTATVDMEFEITPDTTAGSEIWYVSDSFTQSAASAGYAEDKQPTALARLCRATATIPAQTASTAAPKVGGQASFPLIGYAGS